jgi:hypothetical protein
MNRSLRVFRRRWWTTPAVLAVLACAFGCAGGQQVNSQAVAAARELWVRQGFRDYHLEWTVTGPRNNHYFVSVRDGEVRKVESVQPDGSRRELHPGDPRYFGVDGLFLTIADELALLETDRPFGQAKGATAVMRFEPDPKRGYPHWYRRDVMGSSQGVRIDVIRLVPVPETAQSLDH